MPTFSSYNALGTDIQTVEIENNAVTFEKLDSSLNQPVLLETLSYSAETTKTTGTLTAYNKYIIKSKNLSFAASSNYLNLQINGDSSNNYSTRRHNTSTTINTAANQTKIEIMEVNSLYNHGFEISIEGITKAIASGILSFSAIEINGLYSGLKLIDGKWSGGNATQITSFTLYSGTNITGDIEIWGVN